MFTIHKNIPVEIHPAVYLRAKIQLLFGAYFQLGIHHVSDLAGYDHIAFIIAMAVPFGLNDWKRLLLMVTMFTAGHTLTLALATLRIVVVPAEITEFLIPVTILITSLVNLFVKPGKAGLAHYALVAAFGLIHGLGFSNFLIQTLSAETSIIIPLLAFNTGLEAGQIMILSVFLVAGMVVLRTFKVPPRSWQLYISGLTSGIAMVLMLNNKFW